MADQTTATVETLTAEVRVLMVGNRQVTQSVAKQLDVVSIFQIEAWGRIALGATRPSRAYRGKDRPGIEVIGTFKGNLSRATVWEYEDMRAPEWFTGYVEYHDPPEVHAKRDRRNKVWLARVKELQDLPLIVLAGLR